jgi:hypothetical protein
VFSLPDFARADCSLLEGPGTVFGARRNFPVTGIVGVTLFLLFFLSRKNYLFFHSLIGLLAILTGFSMFLFAMATSPFHSHQVVAWLFY